mgnify:CR=1 FL=1
MEKSRTAGFSLIELMVTLAVAAILIAIMGPNMRVFMLNNQLSGGVNDMLHSLNVARSEGVRRNTTVRFQLTSTADSSCALSTTVPNWVVSLDDPSGACDSATSCEIGTPA